MHVLLNIDSDLFPLLHLAHPSPPLLINSLPLSRSEVATPYAKLFCSYLRTVTVCAWDMGPSVS
jgi:hypothetical protein